MEEKQSRDFDRVPEGSVEAPPANRTADVRASSDNARECPVQTEPSSQGMHAGAQNGRHRLASWMKKPDVRKLLSLIGQHKITVLFAVLALAAIVVLLLSSTRTKTTSTTVELGLKNIGELTTQAAYFTNVQTMETSKMIGNFSVPFTSSKYIYSYDGVIKAGYDFEKIGLSVDDESRTVTIALPPAEILSFEVDPSSLKVYHESGNIYTPLTLENFNASETKMKEEALQRSIDNGLFEAAKTNVEVLIKGFLSGSYDPSEYEYKFIDMEADK